MASFRKTIPAHSAPSGVADRLCEIGEYVLLLAGEELPVEQESDRLVYIASGAAKLLSTIAASGQPCGTSCGHVLAFQFPGDIVSILRRPEGVSSLVALDPTECIVFCADRFLDIAQDDPAVLREVLMRSLDSLQRARTRMMQLGHQTARQRVAGFLVAMAERLGDCTAGSCEFDLPMGRSDIGDSLGLTIETVSRQFTDLKRDGLLSIRGRSNLTLKDVAALRKEAAP